MKKEEILKLLTKGGPGASAWDCDAEERILESTIREFPKYNVSVRCWRYEYGMQDSWPTEGSHEKLEGMERVESCVNAIDYMNNWDVASSGEVVFVLHDWPEYVANNYYFVERQKTLINKISETEGMHIMMVGKFEEPLPESYLTYLRSMGRNIIDHQLRAAQELEEVLSDLKVRYI